MPSSPNLINPTMRGFGTEEYGRLPDVMGLRSDSRHGQDSPSFFDPNFTRISGGGNFFTREQDMSTHKFIDNFGLGSTTSRFHMHTDLAYSFDNHNSTADGGIPADPQSPNDVGNSSFNISTQFATGSQDVEAPQQESTLQDGKYQPDTSSKETTAAQPSRATSVSNLKPEESRSMTEAFPYAARPPIAATGFHMQSAFDALRGPTPPVGYNHSTTFGNWQLDGQSMDSAVDSDAPGPQPSNDAHNASSYTLVQGAGDVQEVQPQQQPSQEAGQHQSASGSVSPTNQQKVALHESTPRVTNDRRSSDATPILAQEPTTTNWPPAGNHPESHQGGQTPGVEQSSHAGQQRHRRYGATSEHPGSRPGVVSHPTFGYPQGSRENTFQQLEDQVSPLGFACGGIRRPGLAGGPASFRLLAPASSTATPRQMTQQGRQSKQQGQQSAQQSALTTSWNQPTPQWQIPQTQSHSQASTSKEPFHRTLPSRLGLAFASLANVAPANQFMESVSNMHLLDKMACVDVLMRSDLLREYMKPHLFEEHNLGCEKGKKYRAATLHGLDTNAKIDETQRTYEAQNLKRKREFQDKQIKNECRRRENAARMTAGASEVAGMTQSGSKRPRQAFGSDHDFRYEISDDQLDSNDDSDGDSSVPPRNSPKKHRITGPTPSDLVNKFCSSVNIGNRNPFFDDPIHSKLRNLNTVQLIDPAPEYMERNGEIADTKVEHWRACAGQAAGTVLEQGKNCKNCVDHMEEGSVPFSSCVVIDATKLAGQELKGACMNCVYLGKDQECSLRRVEIEETGAQ
ncbi:e70c681d-7c9d-4258-aeaf-47e5edd6ac97 [Sclerotinia trifoliorum]|uniref:E70c681d-7c9d-4258-aeaf-47e5edd6ac97 n=1 Tax=Sclerotinia trifoliorum TaxID=28548 RepID=A0A8H2VVK4_9HELO|nr:e70c681d-7c9d-4258-aeaf-47e5edd6ac97 [Sclerotinia trifoliorum]